MTLEEEILRVLEELGPQTGADLRETLGANGFGLWQMSMRSELFEVKRVGRRYLRLDKKIEGYARLSPSILREFLTYSVVGLANAPERLEARVEELALRIKEISAAKSRFTQRVVGEVVSRVSGPEEKAEEFFCVLLAGDIVYEMAHDAPRPERSTGTMVRGSDIDLVVITTDQAPEQLVRQIDDAIYEQKYRYLINPSIREEIDYVIKPLERLREQAQFDTFKNMVPCKIMDEAVWLYGSLGLFQAAKKVLAEQRISEKLMAMEEEAARSREKAEKDLLTMDEHSLSGDQVHLFYPTEESEEFD